MSELVEYLCQVDRYDVPSFAPRWLPVEGKSGHWIMSVRIRRCMPTEMKLGAGQSASCCLDRLPKRGNGNQTQHGQFLFISAAGV